MVQLTVFRGDRIEAAEKVILKRAHEEMRKAGLPIRHPNKHDRLLAIASAVRSWLTDIRAGQGIDVDALGSGLDYYHQLLQKPHDETQASVRGADQWLEDDIQALGKELWSAGVPHTRSQSKVGYNRKLTVLLATLRAGESVLNHT